MIAANELRIGNWVIWNEDDTFMRIGATSFLLTETMFGPIIITPDILLRCGFENIKHIDGYSFYSFKRKGNSTLPAISIYENKTLFNGQYVNHITFLHQLQNLFFALTGEELEVRL